MRFPIKRIPKGATWLIIGILRVYQYVISPLFPGCCRFWPSCSEYSIQSLRQFGLVKGILFTILRLLKCHPFHPGGYDPVPSRTVSVKAKRDEFSNTLSR